uniref:probable bifunctional dTTP/UTP pyrophosphatase/methyltransferase protein n=1 Tax=Pristiophorus japonicus TaxID=55135 RepID=UPI00398F7F3B
MVLNPVISKLVGKRVVLASASPRRREILNNVGLRFEVVPSWFKETLDKSAFKMPYDYAKATAKEKALEVARRMHLVCNKKLIKLCTKSPAIARFPYVGVPISLLCGNYFTMGPSRYSPRCCNVQALGTAQHKLQGAEPSPGAVNSAATSARVREVKVKVSSVTSGSQSQSGSSYNLQRCTGVLAYEITNAYQDMTVIVFDLPQVLEKHFQPQSQNLGRISFRKGNFFTDDLPEAELYILLNILHYWTEDKVNLLLSRLSQACKPGCGLLLAELVLYDRKTKPSGAVLQSLNMLMQSEGKERSGSEYRKLLHKHGFVNVQIKHAGTFLDAILCIKQ